jgi:hypothetical protein
VTTKTASLVFFYFGEDSYVKRLAQETVQLHLALTDYDRQILLRHETDLGPFELSERAERKADVVDLPTRENLVKYLNELGDDGYVVDVYVFSHGTTRSFRASRGTYGDNRTCTASYLEQNVNPLKIRVVWQCNCYGSTMADCWHALGAKAVAGSRHVNFYPTRFARFARLWNRGERFSTAVSKSDTKAVHGPVQIFILADALGSRKEWGGCPPGQTVLGKSSCAKAYFTERWFPSDEWQDGKSGRQNMNYQSHMVVSGSRSARKLTKSDIPKW